MKRNLSLRSEVLAELTTVELVGVVGAGTHISSTCDDITRYGCFSLDDCDLPTMPVRTCFPPERA